MTYPEAIQYLEGFINYEKLASYPYKESLKLERIKEFLATVGNPQDSLRCIHVAGTKGKGSTCAFIAYILREAGFRVGLYTSPHLSDFRERIRILECQRTGKSKLVSTSRKTEAGVRVSEFEGMISKRGLVALVKELKPAIDKYNKISKYGPLSFFEVYTALAFKYFKEQKTDFVVLETGLGGRLDATNTVNALVSVITPISYEHTDKLGNTLAEIAGEKAGIIKGCQQPGKWKLVSTARKMEAGVNSPENGSGCQPIVISAPQEKEARQVIKNRCKEIGAKLTEIKQPVRGLRLKLIGEHQAVNAAVAAAAVKAAKLGVSPAAIKKGLKNTVWPGRCEVVAKSPLVILDGAQNTASAEALKRAIEDNFKYSKLLLILGISRDKDIKGIVNRLSPLADKIILTKADNPRAVNPEFLAGYFEDKDNYITQGVREARALSKALAKKKDLILVTGSLFVVGEYRNE